MAKEGFNDQASGKSPLTPYIKRIRASLTHGRNAGTLATATAYDLFTVRAGTVLHNLTARAVTAASVSSGTPLLNVGDGDDDDFYLDAIADSELSTVGDTVNWPNNGSTEGKAADLYQYTSDDTIDAKITGGLYEKGVVDFYVKYTSPNAADGVYVADDNEAYAE